MHQQANSRWICNFRFLKKDVARGAHADAGGLRNEVHLHGGLDAEDAALGLRRQHEGQLAQRGQLHRAALPLCALLPGAMVQNIVLGTQDHTHGAALPLRALLPPSMCT